MLKLLACLKIYLKNSNAGIQMKMMAQKRWQSIKLPCKTNLPNAEIYTKRIPVQFYLNKILNTALVGRNTEQSMSKVFLFEFDYFIPLFRNLKRIGVDWHGGESRTLVFGIHTRWPCCTNQRKYGYKVIKLQARCYVVCYDNTIRFGRSTVGTFIPQTHQSIHTKSTIHPSLVGWCWGWCSMMPLLLLVAIINFIFKLHS